MDPKSVKTHVTYLPIGQQTSDQQMFAEFMTRLGTKEVVWDPSVPQQETYWTTEK